MTEDKNEKAARPWDYINPAIEKLNLETANKRLSICRSCTRYISFTSMCKECGCIMPIKTKLPHAYCPIGKWSAETTEKSENE